MECVPRRTTNKNIYISLSLWRRPECIRVGLFVLSLGHIDSVSVSFVVATFLIMRDFYALRRINLARRYRPASDAVSVCVDEKADGIPTGRRCRNAIPRPRSARLTRYKFIMTPVFFITFFSFACFLD